MDHCSPLRNQPVQTCLVLEPELQFLTTIIFLLHWCFLESWVATGVRELRRVSLVSIGVVRAGTKFESRNGIGDERWI